MESYRHEYQADGFVNRFGITKIYFDVDKDGIMTMDLHFEDQEHADYCYDTLRKEEGD